MKIYESFDVSLASTMVAKGDLYEATYVPRTCRTVERRFFWHCATVWGCTFGAFVFTFPHRFVKPCRVVKSSMKNDRTTLPENSSKREDDLKPAETAEKKMYIARMKIF